MKALKIGLEKYLTAKQQKVVDPQYRPEYTEIVELDPEYPEPELINDQWVKVKVNLGGICGTDMSLINLKTSTVLSNFSSFPCVPGHEIVGTIEEIGGNVGDLDIGDRVILDESLGCEVRGLDPCEACARGEYSLCLNLDKGNLAPGAITGFCKDTGGAWGEHVIAHRSQIFKIPDSLSWEEALLAEPLACSMHASLKRLPKANENCVVVGCGTIGLLAIASLNALSEGNILAVAKYPFQAEMAEKMGANVVQLIKKDRHIKKIGRQLNAKIVSPAMENAYLLGEGADVVIDSVGNASSISDSLHMVKTQGDLVMLGYPSYVETDWTPILAKEVNLTASNIFSYDTLKGKRRRTLQIALDMIDEGIIDTKDFLTHNFPLEKYGEALNIAANKSKFKAIKIAFKY